MQQKKIVPRKRPVREERTREHYQKILGDIYDRLERKCRGPGPLGIRSLAYSLSGDRHGPCFSRDEVEGILSLGLEDQPAIREDVRILDLVRRKAGGLSYDETSKQSICDLCEAAPRRLVPRIVVREDVPELKDHILFLLVHYLHRCGVPGGRELYPIAAAILIYTGTVEPAEFGCHEEFDVFDFDKSDADVKELDRLKNAVGRRFRKHSREIASRNAEEQGDRGRDSEAPKARMTGRAWTLERGSLLLGACRKTHNVP